MYLKRLEVFGFKTFAERTELEFSPGITAIVGPNGAGKSNLADAILWVFGEQSLKALRSSKSQDIIFSGSREKKPVSLAEVSLTLDNSAGLLRLDYPEITVTRRVYRSGEGEYLLNRVPCRLRDIHELFLDTGIGRQAYSIITQSQIDAILSVRPEDRRELVEEAAGVGKYRQRKKEATRKLESTRANLLRVNDIIGELEAQLEPLAEQSEQAREYSRISQELSLLRLSLLVADHDAYCASLEKAREREAELEAEIESCRTKESQFGGDEVRLRAELAKVEESQDELRGLVGRLTHDVDKHEAQEALTREKIASLARQAEGLQEDARMLEKSLQDAKEQQAAAELKQEEITAREQEGLAALRAQDQNLQAAGQELAAREQALTAARAAHLERMGEVSERKNFCAQGGSLLRAAEARMGRLTEEIAAARKEVSTRAATQEDRSRELAALQDSRPQLDRRLEELEATKEAARGKVAEAETHAQSLHREAVGVGSRLQALEELRASREGLSPGARAMAEEGYPLVSELLRIPQDKPRGTSTAIEAALGERLEAVVCKDQAEAMAGRERLREHGGQAIFLTVKDSGRPADRDQQAGQKTAGAVGRAVELVDFAPEYAALFEELLGDIQIAESLEAALALRGRLGSGPWQVVTLEGEVVGPFYLRLGEPNAGGGALSRQVEIDTLRAQSEKLEADAQQAEAARQASQEELNEIETALAQAREACAAAKSQESRLQDTLALLRTELESDRQRLEALEVESKGLQEEIDQSRREQASLEAEIATGEEGLAESERSLQEAQAALSEGRAQRDESAGRLEQMKVAQASLAGERQTQEARLQSFQESQKSLAAQIEARKDSVRALEGERQTLQEGLGAMGARAQQLHAALDKAKAELEEIGQERQARLEAIASRLEEKSENADRKEGLQASLHRLQLRITQLEGEIGFAARNLEEDYRMSLDQAREKAQPIDSRKETQAQVNSLQGELESLGTVNLGAMDEYERVKSRLEFLGGQREDLERAREDLERVIAEIDETAREKFLECFDALKVEFDALFKRLFNGGETQLQLTNDEEILESGIEVEVTVPGKRRQNLLLLSGGERALTAMALIFALLKIKPTPFVVLDEVDAPLDDSNVGRYAEVLRDFAKESQFIIITHNKGTMEGADTLYGVTMQKAGISTLIGMKLTELPAA